MKNERRRNNAAHYSGIEIPIPWNYVLWYTLKAAKVITCAAFIVFMLWFAISVIDVNLHNTTAYSEINEYNFFVWLEKAADVVQQFLA